MLNNTKKTYSFHGYRTDFNIRIPKKMKYNYKLAYKNKNIDEKKLTNKSK